MILIAAATLVGVCFVSMSLLRTGHHTRRAFTWGPLWGTLFGFWSLAPQLLRMYKIDQSSAAEWVLLSLALMVAFAATGLLCAIPAGGLLSVLQRMPPFRGRNPEWTFGLGMIGALPLAYIIISLVLASATGSLPLMLVHNDAGTRRLAVAAATVGIVFIMYLRATRRQWTATALLAPVLAFTLAGIATLPLRIAPVLRNKPFYAPHFNLRPERPLEYPRTVDTFAAGPTLRA